MREDHAPEGIGQTMHGWARELWPYPRSLTGEGVRQTLRYLAELLPGLTQHEIPSGTPAFDWTVPPEWRVREAWVEHESGRRVIDLARHTLHLVGYSEPFEGRLPREELERHLYSLPDRPDWIPYVTSYYQRRWGFCLSDRERRALPEGNYHVKIDTDLDESGSLTYADLVIPGASSDEILLSTYVCHPSMANNELSGPVVATAIGRWLQSLPERRFTYRLVFVPETIGALVYLSRHLDHLKSHVWAGFVLSCLGDDRATSIVTSRTGDTLADRVARHALRWRNPAGVEVGYLERGSDERQYGAPGVDLPVVGLCRSKYGCYPEYHTSADDLDLVTPAGLFGGFALVRDCLRILEANATYRLTTLGEPQLGRRGLYRQVNQPGATGGVRSLMNLLMHQDGTRDLLGVCDHVGEPMLESLPLIERLVAEGLLAQAEPR